MPMPPPIPGSVWEALRRARRAPVSAAAFTNPGLASSPSAAAPLAARVFHLPPLPYFPFLRRWPISDIMRYARWVRPVNPGDVGGPPGSASQKPFLSRVPNPDSPDYNRRMARMTEKLHSIVNSLIGSDQLVQTGQTAWEIRATSTGSGVTSFDTRTGDVVLIAADVLAALQDTLTLQSATTSTLFHLQAGLDSNLSDAFTFDQNVVVGGPDGKIWASDLNLANQTGSSSILVTSILGDVTASFSSLVIARTDTANGFTVGGHYISIQADATKGLQIRQHSGTQSANLQEWTDSTGATVVAYVSPIGSVVATGALPSTANNAPAGVYIGITSTPRIQFADGTHNVTIDNSSGTFRWIFDGNVKLAYTDSTGVFAGAVNVAYGFDSTTAPPYSARFWIYHNIGAGTAASNPTEVIEQNTNGTPGTGFGGATVYRGKSSTTSSQLMGEVQFVWATATHATRQGRMTIGAHDSATSVSSPREGFRVEADGSAARISAFGGTAAVQQSGDVAAALVAYNLLTSPTYGSHGRSTAQTAAVASVAAVTVGASDGSFAVSANVLITTSTLHSFSVTCAYTDESNTARTLTLNFSQLTGAFVTTLTNALGASAYEGVPVHIRAKAGTTITIATTGTFTTVTYNVEGHITQMA